MHAAFTDELPTPAVVIKGVCDAADEQKDNEDEKKYWRDLAKENSIRLALELIRRGRIRPLQTDQFILDPTPGLLSQCRQKIPYPTSPGVSFRFSRLSDTEWAHDQVVDQCPG